MPSQPANPQTQYIDLQDFTPGIFSDYYGSVGAYPDGAAQVNGTWGCVAGPRGGLLPAPRKIDYNIQTTLLASANGYPENVNYDLITGFFVSPQTGITQPPNLSGNSIPIHRACVIMIARQCYNTGSGGGNSVFFQTTNVSVYKPNRTISQAMGGASIYNPITFTSGSSIPYDGSEFNFWSTPMAMTRMNNAAPTTSPGFVVLAFAAICWPSSGGATTVYQAYPANGTPNTDSTENITVSSGLQPAYLVAHQGRLVHNCWQSFANFGSIGTGNPLVSAGTDILDWTQVNQYNAGSGNSNGAVYSPEGPGGIGAMTSMNASEMFVVRRFAGGYTIRGDIANPTILSLPSVTPTGLDGNVGALTPSGYVYGSSEGVFLWSGGDGSTSISDNLYGLTRPRYDNAGNFQRNGPFWRDPTSNIGISGAGGPAASFAYVYPYLYAPGNWIYDTRNSSWFRLTDPSVINYNWASAGPDGTVVLAPTYSGQLQPELFSWWDPAQGTDYFTWTSQPLQKAQGRYIQCRELIVKAQGQGTITVTITDFNGQAAPPTVITIDSAVPQLYSLQIDTITVDAIVNIQSSASKRNSSRFVLDGGVAPRLYSMRIGYTEQQTGRG